MDTTNCKLVLMADVIAIIVLADVIPNVCCRGYSGRWNSHIGWNDFDYGRCYCLCGRWNSHLVNCLFYFFLIFILFYFTLSSEMVNRTSSYMWDRGYLPIFLFRDGLLTHMYIDSFISLMRFWSSLPIILKFFSVVVCPVV